MISMPTDIIVWIESLVVYFFVTITLTRMYGFRYKSKLLLLLVLIGSSIFYLVPTQHITSLRGNFYVFVGALSLVCTAYSALCIKSNLPTVLATMLSLIFSQTLLKGAISFLYIALGFRFNSSSAQLYNTLLLLPGLLLLSLLYQKYPLSARCKLPTQYWLLMILLPVASYYPIRMYLGSFSVSGFAIAHDTSAYMLFITLIGFFVVLGVYFLSSITIKKYDDYLEVETIRQRQALQLDHVERSAAMVDRIRHDRHELKNIFFYINALVEAKNYDELTSFTKDALIRRYDRLEEFNTGNMLIDYLLTQKVSEAREKNIQVLADVILPSDLDLDQSDICSLLMNILDNAIDASEKEVRGSIQIRLSVEKNYLSITVKNYSSIDVLTENPTLRTSKQDTQYHGIGNRVVKAICKKHNGMIRYRMESGYFIVDIMLQLC